MRRRGNSYSDWFFLIIMTAAVVMILFQISISKKKEKPINFQSWTLSKIETHILKPLKEL